MVERQPEKLKVVGSNPIPDKMLYLFIYVFGLLLCGFNPVLVFDLTIFHLFIIFYSYLFCDFFFFKATVYTTTYNVSFFLHYLYIQLKLIVLSAAYYITTFYKSTSITIFTLKWKPLFKKSSYFGIYRSTRNQHLNK